MKNVNKILAALLIIAFVLPAVAHFAQAAPNYDLNGDGKVNLQDLIMLSQHFGENWAPGEFNGGGTVSILDMILLATHFS